MFCKAIILTSTVEKTATKERAETLKSAVYSDGKRAVSAEERSRQKNPPAPGKRGKAARNMVEETSIKTDKK